MGSIAKALMARPTDEHLSMQNLLAIWSGLSASRRAMLIGAVAATLTALGVSVFAARTPEMSLLYAGLEPAVAGDVMMALERMDIDAETRGDAIFVPRPMRDNVRMSLAREGLPAKSQAGYELLDGLSGFATTSEMFDAAYWRAKEGELARTILSVPGVRSARVHIGAAKRSSFDASGDANSAVVTVRMGRGPLNKQQALSIRYLVSLAIAGLPEEKVAVIDAEAGVVLRPGDGAPEAEAMSMANDRERELERRLTSLLEARVGPGAARVSVALELDMEREAMTERILDPESRVTTGRETTDITQNASGAAGAVTVASNLPDGDANGGNQSQSQRNEARERIDYEFSEVRREREKSPGSVKRVSVAVLVDAVREIGGDGAVTTTPRTDEEIESLRQLVESAIGFDEARGDVVTVEAMAFQDLGAGGAEATGSPVGQFLQDNIMSVIKVLIPAIVTLVLGLFVVRPLLSQTSATSGAAADDEEDTDSFMPATVDFAPMDDIGGEIEGPDDSLDKLKEIAADKQEETAALIKTWLERAEEPA
ncbi:MAG: flagellar basal-body MS-ring/collar protein FliF [Pseudomonadota bacterium]